MPETHFAAPMVPDIPPDTIYKSRLLDALYNDPKTRGKTLALIKEHAPHVRIPEIDAQQSVAAQLAPLHQKILDFEGKQLEREAQAANRSAKRRILNEGFVTEDEIPEVEKLMQEEGISKLETAAEMYAHRRRVATPRTGPTPLRLPDYKGLFGNRKQWGREEAYKVINELANARGRGRFL